MHSDLLELGWTEEHINRIEAVVTEEAQKARVAAQVLPLTGPVDPTAVAIPPYTLAAPAVPPPPRLEVDSNPTLYLTKIAVNVEVRHREAADPELNAALTMFRRAANYIARIEDALIVNGRPGPNVPPAIGIGGIPAVYAVTGGGAPVGLFPNPAPAAGANAIALAALPPPGAPAGDRVVTGIIEAINRLDANGQLGPFACLLSPQLFADICTPNANLILPRDRILPFLQGPLLRCSAIQNPYGIVIALSGNPVELVVARDIRVRFLQTSVQARLVFQVSEKVALRIKEPAALQYLI
jgi:uncharacterized linocin/CFP29 family protein